MAYGLLGKFTTKADDREALLALLVQASALMQGAAGCQLYAVGKDATDATGIWVIEVWDDEAAHDQSLTVEGVAELIAQARPLMDGAPTSHTFVPVAGFPVQAAD